MAATISSFFFSRHFFCPLIKGKVRSFSGRPTAYFQTVRPSAALCERYQKKKNYPQNATEFDKIQHKNNRIRLSAYIKLRWFAYVTEEIYTTVNTILSCAGRCVQVFSAALWHQQLTARDLRTRHGFVVRSRRRYARHDQAVLHLQQYRQQCQKTRAGRQAASDSCDGKIYTQRYFTPTTQQSVPRLQEQQHQRHTPP